MHKSGNGLYQTLICPHPRLGLFLEEENFLFTILSSTTFSQSIFRTTCQKCTNLSWPIVTYQGNVFKIPSSATTNACLLSGLPIPAIRKSLGWAWRSSNWKIWTHHPHNWAREPTLPTRRWYFNRDKHIFKLRPLGKPPACKNLFLVIMTKIAIQLKVWVQHPISSS